jgi:WG containing repeat
MRIPTGIVRTLLCTLLGAASCFAQSGKEPLVVVQNGKYGYIDHDGKVIIRPQFIWADDFWQGLGTVYVCGRYASIDRSGTLHPRRIAAEGHLEPKRRGKKYGFVDASGQFRIAPTFDEVLPFSDGLAAVRSGEKWGFIDNSGEVVIPIQLKAAYYFRKGVTMAEDDSGGVLIDRKGTILARGFDSKNLIAEGRVPVSNEGGEGYLDLQGNIAIPLIYESVDSFSGGLAAVRKDGKWGYVNHDGQLVIPPGFDSAGRFASGLAPAKRGDKIGFIDSSGSFAFLLAYDYAPGFLTGDDEDDLYIAPSDVSRFWTKDRKFGYVNTAGRVIWGPVKGSPDHRPLLGWDEADKVASCKDIPDEVRKRVAGFPKR